MLPRHLKKDIEYLIETDRFFKTAPVELPDFSWRKTPDSFSSLVRIVLAQQVSTSVANTLWNRLAEFLGNEISPLALSKASDDSLRTIGLSRQKISYLRGLADATANGTFSPASLEALPDNEIIEKITSMKGFGLWSAQMYLIFTLARPDIWPAQDLIIRNGVTQYLKKKERIDLAQTRKFGEKFKGRRTALALLFWNIKDT